MKVTFLTGNTAFTHRSAELLGCEGRGGEEEAIVPCRHERQVVVSDRRVGGKETQRASEAAPPLPTKTLHTSAPWSRHMENIDNTQILDKKRGAQVLSSSAAKRILVKCFRPKKIVQVYKNKNG